ncbi:MAG TPA: class I SAM-dependent methyltransferase [Thermoanaerobaculia bacterium]|nr:class I SAM-dependent methyltransferase [Thermoanaerobaculia bacterium]
MSHGEREAWDQHWRELEGGDRSLFGTLASLVRKTILCRAVRHYTDRYFPPRGLFVEPGCGTAQASARVAPLERGLVAFDFSLPALAAARGSAVHRHFVCGDIRRLPFRDGSVAGIWNLGVMEHFHPGDGREILEEFRRVLAPRGCAILFWPPEFGLSRWVLAPFEWIRGKSTGKPFQFFPDEVNRLRSLRHARETLRGGGLEPVAADFTPRDSFIHVVAVGRKPAA